MHNSFSILLICTGNICRSPLAEHVLLNRLRDVPEITVSSAGTRAMVGHPMFDISQEIARSYGAENTATHRARQLTETMLEASDLVLTMTREHRREVVELSPRVVRRTFTVREFARLAEATTEEALVSQIGPGGELSAEKLRATVEAATFSRSILPPVVDRTSEDVLDPYERDEKIHKTSANQLTPAIDSVASLLMRPREGAI